MYRIVVRKLEDGDEPLFVQKKVFLWFWKDVSGTPHDYLVDAETEMWTAKGKEPVFQKTLKIIK